MVDDRGTLRQVAWTELFPWLLLGRSLHIATQARLLGLAAVALALTVGGWWFFGQLFRGTSDEQLTEWIEAYSRGPQLSFRAPEPTIDEMRRAEPGIQGPENPLVGPSAMGRPHQNPITAAWYNLSGPFRQLFEPRLKLAALAFLILCALWVDLVWSFFGGVITRLVALQVTTHERGSLRGAIRFVLQRYLSYFSAPLYPLFGALLFVAPLAVVGLVGRTGGFGVTLLAIVWPAFLVVGLLITIFLVGLLFGWPLMWPTISAEGTDSFDALSRSYSYVFQRPLHFLWYAVVASVLGALGWLVVRLFAMTVIYLTAWSVSWGAGAEAHLFGGPALIEAAPAGAHILSFWMGLVRLFAAGFLYTFFLTTATISYVLLRHEVDGTETDEVFVENQPEKFGLPSVAPDAAGVPTVADDDEPASNGASDTGM